MTLITIIICLSWGLNAAMDSIDHAKPTTDLGLLWHTLKWLSYALPFGYILFFSSGLSVETLLWYIPLLILATFILWESLYRFLRNINLSQWDK